MSQSAAIYARISADDGTALGVARQIDDCGDEARRRGWTVVETFVDNDVSASRGRGRPEYERMLTTLRRGDVGALVVWDVDRLTRTPRELEDFIDIANTHRVELASVGGDIDLATEQGRMMARMKGSVARYEVEQSSRRLRAKFRQRAEDGQPHGKVAYGYSREVIVDDDGRRVGAKDVINEAEAEVIRDATRRILAGQSLRSVWTSLNERRVPSPRGGRWDGMRLRQVLLRQRNAGRRVHRGEVIGRGQWPAVVDEDDFDRLVALLRDPSRRTQRGSEVKYLLSGLARCGRCGTHMRATVGHHYQGKVRAPTYTCPGCHRVRRAVDKVDAVVEGVVIERLSRPDGPDLLAGDATAFRDATKRLRALEARLGTAADQYADEIISASQLERITAKLRPKMRAEQESIARASPQPKFEQLTRGDIAKRWTEQSLEIKRAAIDILVCVTIMPTGSGGGFDPEAIAVRWRTGR